MITLYPRHTEGRSFYLSRLVGVLQVAGKKRTLRTRGCTLLVRPITRATVRSNSKALDHGHNTVPCVSYSFGQSRRQKERVWACVHVHALPCLRVRNNENKHENMKVLRKQEKCCETQLRSRRTTPWSNGYIHFRRSKYHRPSKNSNDNLLPSDPTYFIGIASSVRQNRIEIRTFH